MKKLMVLTVAALAATALMAAPTTTRKSSTSTRGKSAASAKAVDEDKPTSGNDAKVTIDMPPRLNKSATFSAPSVNGATYVSSAYTRPRKWIVIELKYTTYAEFQDQLTFTWHVLLDTKTSTLNRNNKHISPYSYFTTSVTYQNIPDGSHAASVVLPPSYLERYGEPCAVGFVITNAKGEVLGFDCESSSLPQAIQKNVLHPKSLDIAFWNNRDIMEAVYDREKGTLMIERRQGLKDRSKTIWALVNPNDYEDVAE